MAGRAGREGSRAREVNAQGGEAVSSGADPLLGSVRTGRENGTCLSSSSPPPCGVTLPNRIVISPMCQYSAEDNALAQLEPYAKAAE
jgi:hypothetical protein